MKRFFAARGGDPLFAAGLLIIAVAYLALAYTYKPALRAVPAIVAWILVVLLMLDLASRTETRLGHALRRRVNPAAERPPYSATRQLEAILWIAGFAAALILIGVLYAVPLFVFTFMRFRGHRPIWASLLGGGAVLSFIWLLFVLLLRLPLYPGLIFGGA